MKISSFINLLKNSEDFGNLIAHHHIIPQRKAAHCGNECFLAKEVNDALKHLGINQLYSHQYESIKAAREGKNIILSTPTSSGKTLAYNIPVFESVLSDDMTRAFYIFPLKALGQDQLKTLIDFSSKLPGKDIKAEIYDGDTPSHVRKKIANNNPHIIITNPDMLHLGFLAYHHNWADFFKNMKYIIIDELHTYRGVFGSHIAQILRRLRRICLLYGSNPYFITCSATIDNPSQFAETLTGVPFHSITENGAPNAGGHFLFLNPALSAYTETAKLFRLLCSDGFKIIAFTKSRKATELIYTWISQVDASLRKKVSSYRAGFLPEERREIEAKLFSDELQGVIATSALEMGIDVGGLDVCLLVGYPGTVINTWQRGGRVGRGTMEYLIILIAQQDALDQYFMRNPTDFFQRGYERAVLDPDNPEIVKQHLVCAASESPLNVDDQVFNVKEHIDILHQLSLDGQLQPDEENKTWYSSRKRPHRLVDIRSAGEGFTIFEDSTNRVIGKVSGGRVFTECHKGAIYLHKGSQYAISRFDLDKKNIYAIKRNESYYTRAKEEKETEILSLFGSKPVMNFVVKNGRLKVTSKVTGYEKRIISGQELLSHHELNLPEQIFETVGFWIEIDDTIKLKIENKGNHHMGAIHAVEHAAISMFPLFVLCDRDDIGGISYTHHPQVKKGAIFIYDGHPGGVGLAKRGFDVICELLQATLKLIIECKCEEGCPSCIHSPKCGSGNKPLDKQGALDFLKLLLDKSRLKATKEKTKSLVEEKLMAIEPVENIKRDYRILFFDIETQRSASEVGGWKNLHLMKVAVAVVYDSLDQKFISYLEEEMEQLVEKLKSADLVVGFNLLNFDYGVLQPYTIEDLKKLKTFDILDDIRKRLGFRLSLNHLANKTLKVEKSADGLQSLQWFKEGKIDLITEYCTKDVEITRDLFQFGIENEYLLYERRDGGVVRLPLDWELDKLVLL